MYGVDKMFLMMEKQKNRGQDGAGYASIKFDLKPGQNIFIELDHLRIKQYIQYSKRSIKKLIHLLSQKKSLKVQTPFIKKLLF